jgi:hypothetical protein
MALSSWQRIDRVLPGQPFGDGRNGAYTSTDIPTLTVKTCSGTATSTTLTADTDASPFAVGDVLYIHQSRGTGVGQWEINRVSSVGSDQYTLQTALKYTYTDSGASQAQAIKIPMYSSINVASGTWTATAWAGDVNGILPIACNGNATFANAFAGNGKGFRGETTPSTAKFQGEQGEGTAAAGGTISTAANGSGGGGGQFRDGIGTTGGGGGGHAAAGETGHTSSVATPGTGGSASGSADLTTMTFGGGGGTASGVNEAQATGSGSPGGAMFALFVKNPTFTGAWSLNGTDGGDCANEPAGGGGAGGSGLIVCQTATLGTAKITAAGGARGDGLLHYGGAGAAGRIAVHHSGTVTGTTTPTFEDVTDVTLIETLGGSFIYNLI